MRKKFLAGAVAVGAVAVAVGSASTASNTVPASVAGYGSSTISGATATSLDYTLSSDGTQITGADLKLQGDQSGRTVSAGFGSDPLTVCQVNAFDSAADNTPVTCSGFTQSTSTASTFNVAVN